MVSRWIPPDLNPGPQGRLSRGILNCPHPAQVFYDPGTVGPPPTNTPTPGVLGEIPKVHVGSFDLRPWEQPFESPRWRDWQRRSKPVWGESLTLRVIRRAGVEGASLGIGPLGNVFDYNGNSVPDAFAYLSVLLSVWNDTIGDSPGPPNRDPEFPEPVADQGLWQLQTRLGPNIMPELAGVGSADVDVLEWARGARFVAVWLWYYWVGLEDPELPDVSLAWEARDDSPAQNRQTNIVTWPVRAVHPAGSAHLNGVFRYNALPAADHHRLGVYNGGSNAIDLDFRQFAGANVFDVTSVAGLAPGGSTILSAVTPDAHNPYSVQAEHEAAAGTMGPVILSLVANSVTSR